MAPATASLNIASVADKLAALVARLNNPETELEARALGAAAVGHAAFWTTGTSHQATLRLFAYTANNEGIRAALHAWVDAKWPGGLKTAETLIGSLIPLNAAAVAAVAAVTLIREAA